MLARVTVKIVVPNDLQTKHGIKMELMKYYIEEALRKELGVLNNVTEIMQVKK